MAQPKKMRPAEPVYFATLREPDEYVDACLEKIAVWRQWAASKGLMDLWSRKMGAYYGWLDGASSQRVLTSGTEGELSNIKINDLRTLVQSQLVTVTSMRPAGIARAVNADVKSLRNSRIGTAIAEYYLSQSGFEGLFVQACEAALVVDEAYLDLFWDKGAGDPIRPDMDPTGKPMGMIMSGDAKMRLHCPWNVARDPAVAVDRRTWNIISILFNRFDLAAANPKFAKEILAAEQDMVPQHKLQERPGDDNVYLHLVVHDRTPACPKGRYSMIVGDTLIGDTLDASGEPSLPYPEYPVDRMSPADVIDGPTGYCPSNDVMAMEQVTDALHGIVTTNNITFGGQSVVGPPLTGITISEVAKGLRYFEVAPDQVDKIQPLQLTKTSPETYQYIATLSSKKQEVMGSMAGTLQAQATQGASGSAMALIQAQSVQFNSGTQRSYFKTMSRSMTKLIGVLRVYADTPRVARIVGKSKAMGLKEFKYTGKDLNSISSIVYEPVNPVSQTLGGRMQMAETLIQNGQISSPKQYLTVVETGNLDAMTNPDEDKQLLILEENEWLSEGKPVQAVVTENASEHIMGHMSVLSSPQAKSDPTIVQTVMQHIQEHLNLWQDASMNNPAILLATGQQPLPPPPAPPGMVPPGGPGGPPPGAGPGGPPPKGKTGEIAGNPMAASEAQQPQGPRMPINPATGERVPVPGGLQ
jgi:hypothetical protein